MMEIENLGKATKAEEQRQAQKRKNNAQKIAEIAVKARKANMSYGQYEAMKYMEKMKQERLRISRKEN